MVSQDKKIRHRWLLACGLGIPVGLAIGHAISLAIGYTTGISKIWAMGFFVLGPGLAGMVVGVAQWLVLSDYSLLAHRWIVATSISWVAAHAVTVLVSHMVYGVVNLALWQTANLAMVWVLSGAISGLVSGAIGGVVVGLAQGWAFRGQGLALRRWLLATGLAWAIGHAVIGLVEFTAIGTMGLAFSWMTYGVVYGAITSHAVPVLDRSKH
jgi:hypothetical protein